MKKFLMFAIAACLMPLVLWTAYAAAGGDKHTVLVVGSVALVVALVGLAVDLCMKGGAS